MLIITNGRMLVNPTMDEDQTSEFIETLVENIKNLFDMDVIFEKKEKPFLGYEKPEELSMRDIKDALPEGTRLEFMAIGKNDEVHMPHTITKNFQYYYDAEELKLIADEMCLCLDKQGKLESEKKSINKRLGENISQLQTRLHEFSKKHSQGYEHKDIKVYCILNYKEKRKYFHDTSTGELVDSQEMTEQDIGSIFDVRGFDPEKFDEKSLQGLVIDEQEEMEEPNSEEEQEEISSDSEEDDILNAESAEAI